jgi:hypothetical protein
MWQRFKSWFRYEKYRPKSPTTLRAWGSFYERYRKEAPIRHYLNNHFKRLSSGIKNRYWELQYRFNPNHQYHIVRTNLEPGYYDKDEIMLHAVFTLIQQFVEEELNQNPKSKNLQEDGLKALDEMIAECKGEFEAGHREAYETLREIYLWWVDEYPKGPDLILESLIVTDNPIMFASDDDEPVLLEYLRWFRIQHDHRAEQDFERRTDEMLAKAIKIRKMLWT